MIYKRVANNRFRRMVKCSAYVISRKYGSEHIAPLVADVSVNDIHSHGHFDLQNYVVYHIQLYMLSFVLIQLLKHATKRIKNF